MVASSCPCQVSKKTSGSGWVKCNYYFALHKKWSFPLRISSVNVTKSAVSWGFSLAFTEVIRNGKLRFLCSEVIWTNYLIFFWDERLQVLRKIAVREIFCEKKYEKRFCKIPEVFYSFAMKRSPKFFIVLPWKGAHCRCLRGSLAILFRNFFFRAARDVFRILSSIWDGVFYLAL